MHWDGFEPRSVTQKIQNDWKKKEMVWNPIQSYVSIALKHVPLVIHVPIPSPDSARLHCDSP